MSIPALDLAPESLDLARQLARVRQDIVKSDHLAVRHERRIHLEVLLDAFIGVIAVDHQEVDLFALQDLFEPRPSTSGVRIIPDEM